MYGLIGAMSVEVEALMAKLEDRQERRIGMDVFVSGKLYGHAAVLAVCGPGKINAALCAQSMILHYQPEWVLNLGVAGAGANGVSIGDMVIATAAVQHDVDTSPIGDPVGMVSKINLIEIPCDDALRARLVRAASAVEGMNVHEGVIATGDQFICTQEQKDRIVSVTAALCTEMEGAAIAQTAYRNNLPFVILRAISDKADDSAEMDYPTFERIAAHRCAEVTRNLAKQLKKSL